MSTLDLLKRQNFSEEILLRRYKRSVDMIISQLK
jgi:hypothetical protein